MKIFEGYTEDAKKQIDTLVSPWKERFEASAKMSEELLSVYLERIQKRMRKQLRNDMIREKNALNAVPEKLKDDYLCACRALYNTQKVTQEEIESSSKKRHIADGRIFISSIFVGLYPYKEIARCMSMLNHTSIGHHIKAHSDYMATDPAYKDKHQKFVAEYNRLKSENN